jgi:hypothetical protein
MKRLPAAVFAALVAATVAAFFITQHLKVQNPFINGLPRADPKAINPIAGRVCLDAAGKRVSFKRTTVNFYLQTQPQTVDVFVFNSDGIQVATAGPGRFMREGPNHRASFTWNGRLSDDQIAPDGTYYLKASLPSEDRTLPVGTVTVTTQPPRPEVTNVWLTGAKRTADVAPILSPGLEATTVTVHYTRWDDRDARIEVYRTDLPGGPRVVFAYGANPRYGIAPWNGEIDGRPAPAGTYLIGMRVTDQACNVGRFPIVTDPPPGSTPHAGVTVRYLAAQPPLEPTPAGSSATVLVDSRRRPYTWALFAAGSPKVLAHGAVNATQAATPAGVILHVHLPGPGAGLYEVAIHAGPHSTIVPLIASARATATPAKVLVVLPALSWQGANPVDDTGDGFPNTLSVTGDTIELERPFADGLPAGLPDEIGVLRYLASQHESFDLTSDVALAEGAGPSLAGRTGVLLDGTFTWLPASVAGSLRSYVQAGGHVVAIGVGSLQAQAPLRAASGPAGPTAGPAAALATDPFGARHGALVPRTTALITMLDDGLGIFSSLPAISGFDSYQPITPPAAKRTSEAGVALGVPAVTGFTAGRGSVVEVGLAGFGSALARNVDAQGLLTNLWHLLSR